MEIHPEDRDLIEKLAKLQGVHGQLQQLRTLLPDQLLDASRMPIRSASGSRHGVAPGVLLAHLRKVAVEGNRTVEAFSKAWHSDEMQKLWEESKQASFPQGNDVWTVNYRQLAAQVKDADTAQAESTGEQPDGSGDSAQKVVEKFREQHPTLSIQVLDEANGMALEVKIAGHRFHIARDAKDKQAVYEIRTSTKAEPTELEQGMIRCLQSRAQPDNLEYLLVCPMFLRPSKAETHLNLWQSMLNSYANVNTQPCDKCGRIFDDDLQLPVMRQPVIPPTADDEIPSRWRALHRLCS